MYSDGHSMTAGPPAAEARPRYEDMSARLLRPIPPHAVGL